jgi:hypothetical protein
MQPLPFQYRNSLELDIFAECHGDTTSSDDDPKLGILDHWSPHLKIQLVW